MATTHSPDTDSLFSSTPQLRAQLAQLQTTLSQQMNKPTFQLKPLGAALRLQTTQKKQVSTIQRNIHKQFYNSLTDTPLNKLFSFHNLLRTSCSRAVKHMKLRIVASVSLLPEDSCFHIRLLLTLQMWYSFAPTKVRQVSFATNL